MRMFWKIHNLSRRILWSLPKVCRMIRNIAKTIWSLFLILLLIAVVMTILN